MEREFELTAVKFAGGVVDCKYVITATDDEGVVTEQSYHVKDTKPVHPDLRKLFEDTLVHISALISDNTEYIGELELGECRIVPEGVSFSGKGDNRSARITGDIKTKFGRASFKGPRIKYMLGESDVDAELTKFADALVSEMYAYLFEGKVGEVEVFGE